MTKKSQVVGF